jgi:hypothetical protein
MPMPIAKKNFNTPYRFARPDEWSAKTCRRQAGLRPRAVPDWPGQLGIDEARHRPPGAYTTAARLAPFANELPSQEKCEFVAAQQAIHRIGKQQIRSSSSRSSFA